MARRRVCASCRRHDGIPPEQQLQAFPTMARGRICAHCGVLLRRYACSRCHHVGHSIRTCQGPHLPVVDGQGATSAQELLPRPRRAAFIVLEGPDGCGKTTQARLLADAIGGVAIPSLGPDPLGQLLRSLLTGAGPSTRPEAFPLLFAANRLQADAAIADHLAAGRSVVSDRWAMSSGVYQRALASIGMSKADTAWTTAVDRYARIPDLTLILDVPAPDCMSRLAARAGVQEVYETPAIFAAVHEGYANPPRLPGECVAHVDATGDAADVTQRLLDTLAEVGIT